MVKKPVVERIAEALDRFEECIYVKYSVDGVVVEYEGDMYRTLSYQRLIDVYATLLEIVFREKHGKEAVVFMRDSNGLPSRVSFSIKLGDMWMKHIFRVNRVIEEEDYMGDVHIYTGMDARELERAYAEELERADLNCYVLFAMGTTLAIRLKKVSSLTETIIALHELLQTTAVLKVVGGYGKE